MRGYLFAVPPLRPMLAIYAVEQVRRGHAVRGYNAKTFSQAGIASSSADPIA